jgi:poly-gamma-glutamate synthesis protein (capsule biosynthesis protein)
VKGAASISFLVVLGLLCSAAPAAGQAPAAGLELSGPRLVATGVGFTLEGRGATPGTRLQIELRLNGRWRPLAGASADAGGRFARRLRPRRARRRYVLRALAPDGRASDPLVVRSRNVTLAAVGDINLGNGPGLVIAQRGARYPWTGVARRLRRPDIAFGNLECAVSTRGAPVPKQFNFRGRPSALRVLGSYAGFDVLNLANNHAGDYGSTALLDTVRYVRRFGMTAVGAGGSLASAARPRVVERLGLRVAFVGFSDILPASFFAGPNRPGTQAATFSAIRGSVRTARRRADVVIATFHWGVERAVRENARQRAFASAALAAGATAVIGAHPHVLQPIRRNRHKLVAFSLGNFVFGAASPVTTRTGILRLRLSTRGVEGSRFLPARIEGTRPRLL